MAGCLSELPFDSFCPRFGQLVIVVDIGSQSLHFGIDGTFDVTVLCAGIDDEGMTLAVARCELGLFLRNRSFLPTKRLQRRRDRQVRHALKIAALLCNRAHEIRARFFPGQISSCRTQLGVEFLQLLLTQGDVAAALHQAMFGAEFCRGLFRVAKL